MHAGAGLAVEVAEGGKGLDHPAREGRDGAAEAWSRAHGAVSDWNARCCGLIGEGKLTGRPTDVEARAE